MTLGTISEYAWKTSPRWWDFSPSPGRVMLPISTVKAFENSFIPSSIWRRPSASAPRNVKTIPLSTRSSDSFISWQATTLR